MEDCAGGVSRLKIILNVERLKDILRERNRKMRAVGVIGSAAVLSRGDDIRELRDVMLCEAVGGGLCGSCLKVVEIAVLLLIVGETLTHMVEDFLCKLLSLFVGHVRSEPLGVEADLVHADKAYC